MKIHHNFSPKKSQVGGFYASRKHETLKICFVFSRNLKKKLLDKKLISCLINDYMNKKCVLFSKFLILELMEKILLQNRR